MKIRLVGGGLAAVLAVLSLSSQARAASAVYFQENFNSYDYSTAPTAYLNTDTGGGNPIQWFSANALGATVAVPNQTFTYQTYQAITSNYTNGNWYTVSGSANVSPRFTIGHYVYQTNVNGGAVTSPSRVFAAADESPFSSTPGGSGLNMVDARTNDGPSRRMGVQWNVAAPGNPGDGSGTVVASFDYIMHDMVNLNFTTTGANNYQANQDNMTVVVRLFDSQRTAVGQPIYAGASTNISVAQSSGIFLQLAPTTLGHDSSTGLESGTGGGFNILNYTGGTASAATMGFANPSSPTTPVLFAYETWYHFEIVANVHYDGTPGNVNNYSLIVTPYGGSATELVSIASTTTLANFRQGNTLGFVQHIDSLQIGTLGGASVVGDYSFDNISIVPEPATMGLLTLGAALLLPRRRQRA